MSWHGWWRRWRLRRRGLLFEYFDGRRSRFQDPLRLWRRLAYHPQNLLSLAAAVDEGREPESTQFLDGLAEVFEVKRFDSCTAEGLTDAELLELFTRFGQFLSAQKKKVDRGSILS